MDLKSSDFLIQPCGKSESGKVFVKTGQNRVKPATGEEIAYAANNFAGFSRVRKMARKNVAL
jgi:hypothetical protein